MSTNIRFKRSDIPGKVPSLDSIDLGEIALNTADGKLFTKQEIKQPDGFAAIQKIIEIGATEVPNVLYVAKNGDDSNSGKTLGQAFLTLKKALSIATPGTTIFLKSGEYIEDNPLRVPARVSVVGDNLRNTTVRPKNPTKDIFWVYNGAYIFCMNFKGHIAPSAAVCFPPDGSAGEIVTSPYTQAVTSITTTGTGMRVDGALTTGLRSMVCDAFTQYNQGGIGIHMLNRGNTQLVSIFTICCDISFMCENGGFCSVNLSNSSFGNYGLVSRGASDPLYRGVVKKSAGRQITFKNLARRPNIGDGVLFADYNQKTCDRDNGLIVDSLAFDLLYEGTTQSTFSGLRYWAKDGITIGIEQQEQTAAAIKRAQTVARSVITDTSFTSAGNSVSQVRANALGISTASVGGKTFLERVDTAKRLATEGFDIISRIVATGPKSPALIIGPDLDAAEPEYKILREQVLDRKSQIVDETIAFLKTNFSTVAYVTSKCKRDIDLIIEAVVEDMIFGTNYKTIKAAISYLKAVADTYTVPDEQRTATIEAYKFARDKIVPLVQENDTLLARVQNSFTIITTALANGGKAYIEGLLDPTAGTYALTFPAQQDTDPDVLNLVKNLQKNKKFVVAEVIDYINKNWPTVVAYDYDTNVCGRDIGYAIDAACYDLVYGGNSQTLDAARRYFNYASGLSQLKSSEEVPATIDAFGRAQLLSQRVVILDKIEGTQPVPQVFKEGSVDLVPTTQTQVNRLGGLFSIFLKQLETEIVGTSDFIQPNGSRLNDSGLENAFDLLQANKQFIKNDVINYLAVAYPGFDYDKVKCARDVGYIIDSICFDIVHGGNRQAVTAGIYYFDFNEDKNVLTSIVPKQIKQTVNAYKYMKELLRDVLTCSPTPNPWQGAVPQITNLPAATGSEVVAVGNLIDIINEILQEGPNNTEDSIQRLKQPIGLIASTDVNKQRAFNLLMANRQFIRAEMIAYINQNWFTISDGDTQFARVNTATDLTLGTTTTGYPTVTYQPSLYKSIRDAVLAAKEDIKTETIKFMANSFFDNFSFNKPKCYRDVGLILDAILSDMIFGSNYKTITAAISYLRAYASEVVGAQKVQTVASLKAAKDITLKRIVAPSAKEEISTRFDIVIDILDGARVNEDGDIITNAIIDGVSYSANSGYSVSTSSVGIDNGALNYPIPVRNSEEDIDRYTAVEILRKNINFIKDEVASFIDANFTLNEFDREKCARDVGLIVDAIGYDLMFLSNFRSISAGRAYLRANSAKVTGSQKLATLGSFKHLKKLAVEIVKGNNLAVNSVERSMDIILDILDKGPEATPKYVIPFPATGRNIEFKRARDLVEKNRDFIIDDVVTYVNTPGLVIMPAPVEYKFKQNQVTNGITTKLFETDGQFVIQYPGALPNFLLAPGDLVRVSGKLFGTSSIEGYSSGNTYKVATVTNNGAATTTTEFKLVNLDGSALVVFGGTTGKTDTMRFEKVSAAAYAQPTGFDVAKCRRDLELILDAIFYDTTYGGTMESEVAGKSYVAGVLSQLDPLNNQSDEVSATLRAYEYLRQIIGAVAQDVVWTPTVGNTTLQVRSPNGSDGSLEASLDMQTCVSLILKLIDDANDENLTTSLYTISSAPDLGWVDPALVQVHKALQAAKEKTKEAVTDFVDENYVLFGYDRGKCRRDVELVVEAVRYDLLLNSNFRSIVAGRSYYRQMASVVVKDQKSATLASFQHLKEKLLEIVKPVNPENPTTAEAQSVQRVTRSMDIILKILENGLTAEPTFILTTPTGGTGNAYATAARLTLASDIEINRTAIENDLISWINANKLTYGNPSYDENACRRDIEYILDALRYDLIYGGDLETRNAAKAYYAATDDDIPTALGTGEQSLTLAAYDQLKTIIDNYSAASVTPSSALIDKIIYYITNGAFAAIEVPPDVNWVESGVKLFGDKLALRSTINSLRKNVTDFVDINFAYNEAKCRRDVGFLIDAMCYDLLYGGNVDTTQAATSYYDGAVTPKSIIPKQIIQTVAAYERLKEVLDQVVQLKDVRPSGNQFAARDRVNSSFDLIIKLLQDGISFTPKRPFLMPAPTSGSDTAFSANYADAVKQVQGNRAFLIAETTAFIQTTYPTLEYNRDKCERDVSYLIDAVLYDLTYGGNSASHLAGKAYYEGNWDPTSTTTGPASLDGELTESIAAYNYLGDLLLVVAQGQSYANAARSTKQNAVVQKTGTGGSLAAGQKAQSLIKDVVVKIIDGNANADPTTLDPPGTSWVDSKLVALNSAINLAAFRTAVKAEVNTLLTTKFDIGYADTQKTQCEADIDDVIDAVRYDVMFGSNYRSQLAGNAYYRGFTGLADVIASGDRVITGTVTAGSFVAGKKYKIVNLGTTTDWNTAAGTTGVTYVVGDTFTAAVAGTGDGTVNLVVSGQKDASVATFELVRDAVLEKVALYTTEQVKTGAAGSAAAGDKAGDLIQVVIDFIDDTLTDPTETLAPTDWVDADLVALSTVLANSKTGANSVANIPLEITNYLNDRFEGALTYSVTDCQEDIRSITDAVRFDMMFDSNFRTISAARAYFRAQASKVVGEQKFATLEAFRLLKEKLSVLVNTSAVAVERVQAKMDLLINIVDKGESAIPAYVLSSPTGYNTTRAGTVSFGYARNLIESNREFIKSEILKYIRTNPALAGLDFVESKCVRDMDLLLDAVYYDMTYGGNMESVIAGGAYYRGSRAGDLGAGQNPTITGDDVTATIAAFGHLRDIIKLIAQGKDVSDLQVIFPQVLGDPGSIAAASTSKNLILTIRNLIRQGYIWKGKWITATAYKANDLVMWEGYFWLATQASSSQNPFVGSSYWKKQLPIEPDTSWVPDNVRLASNLIELMKTSDDASGGYGGRTAITAQITEWIRLQLDAARFNAAPAAIANPGSGPLLDFVSGKGANYISSVGTWTDWFVVIPVTSMVQNMTYKIANRGTNGTFPASSGNNSAVGDEFVASGAGTGDGTVVRVLSASDMVAGRRYKIKAVGTTTPWLSLATETISSAVNSTFIKNTVTGSGDGTVYEMFTYDIDKCERDVLYILDAVRYDMMFDSRFRTATAARSYWRQQSNLALASGSTNNSIYPQKVQSKELFTFLKKLLRELPAKYPNKSSADKTIDQLPAITSGSVPYTRIGELMDLILDALNATSLSNLNATLKAKNVNILPLPTGGINNSRDLGVRAARDLVEANRAFIKAEVIDWIDEQRRQGKEGFQNNPAGTYSTDFVFNRKECSEDLDLILDAVYYDLTYGGSMESTVAGMAYYSGTALASLPADEREATIRTYAYLSGLVFDIARSTKVTSYQKSLEQLKGTAGSVETARRLSELVDIVLDVVKGGTKQKVTRVDPDFLAGDETLAYVRVAVQEQKFELQARIADYIDSFILQYNTEKCARDVGLILDAAMYDMVLNSNFQSVTAGSVYLQKAANVVYSTQIGPQLEAIKFIRDRVIEISQKPPLVKNEDAIGRITNLFDVMFDIIDKGVEVAPPVVNVPPIGAAFNPNAVNAANSLIANKEFLKEEVVAYVTANYKTYDQSRCSRDVGLIIDAALYDLLLNTNYNSVKAGLAYRRATSSLVLTDQLQETLGGIDYAKQAVVELLDDADAIASVTRSFELISSIIGGGSLPEVRTPAPGGSVFALSRPTGSVYRDPKFKVAAEALFSAKSTLATAVTNWIAAQTNNQLTGITIASDIFSVDTPSPILANGDKIKLKVTLTNSTPANAVAANTEVYVINVTAPATGKQTFKVSLTSGGAAITGITTLSYSNGNLEVMGKGTGIWSGFTYDAAKCQEDIGFIIDALRYDLTYGGNMESLVAGYAYYDGTVFTNPGEIPATIAAYTYLADEVRATVNSALSAPANTDVLQALEARDLVLIIRNLLDARANGIPSSVLPSQVWVDPLLQEINQTFIQEKPRLQDVIIDYVNNIGTFTNNVIQTPADYDTEKCQRDVGLVLDAIRYDLMFGSTFRTTVAARSYRRSLASEVSGIGAQATANISAFKELKERVLGKKLVNVRISSVTGDFTCDAPVTDLYEPLKKNQPVRVSGVYAKDGNGNQVAGTLQNFSNIATQPKTYYIIGTPTTTSFQLSESVDGAPITTTLGTSAALSTSGLTFEIRPSLESLDEVTTQGLLDVVELDAETSAEALVVGREYKIVSKGKTLVPAGEFQVGGRYIIEFGSGQQANTDFTQIGAANSLQGTVFVATGTGSGTGTAYYYTDYTEFGALNNNIGTTFVATGTPTGVTKGSGRVRTLNFRERAERLFDMFLAIINRDSGNATLTSLGYVVNTTLDVPAYNSGTNNQLNGALNSSAQTITVDSTAGFPSSGTIKINLELISYTGVSPTTFTGCTRGSSGTTASAHDDNAIVYGQTFTHYLITPPAFATTDYDTVAEYQTALADKTARILARDKINNARQTLEDGLITWIGSQITDKNGNFDSAFSTYWSANSYAKRDKCREDIKYLLDAIAYDLTFGGNQETLVAGKAYYDGTSLGVEKLATIDAYNYFKTLISSQLNFDLAGLVITGTAGQFTTTSSGLRVGDTVVISGTNAAPGTGTMTNGTYVVASKSGTAFTLTTVAGAAITTVAGTPSGQKITVQVPDASNLLDQVISLIDPKIEDPKLVEADTSWVDSELYVFSDKLKAAANTVAKATTDYVNANFAGLSYNVATCQRDVKLIIDAVRWDMMFDSNFRTKVAAASYYRAQASTVVGLQKEATEKAFGVVKVALDDLVKSDSVAQTRVAALMDIVINLLAAANKTAALATLPATKLPYGGTPNASNIGYLNARDRVERNRDYILDEMGRWLDDQSYSFTNYNKTTCLRDIELVLDAVRYDLTYGGTMSSAEAGQAYYAGAVLANSNADHINATKAAFGHLKAVIVAVANNTDYTETTGTINVTQVRDAASDVLAEDAAGATQAGACVDVVISWVDSGSGTAATRPSTNWVDNNLALIASTMYDRITSLALQVTDFVEAEFPGLMSAAQKTKCARDVGLITEAVRWDMMFATNFRSWTAGHAYYRDAVNLNADALATQGQKEASLAAFRYLKSLLVTIAGNNVTAVNRVKTAMNVVLDTIEQGKTTRNANDARVVAAVNAIDTGKGTLLTQMTAWLRDGAQNLSDGQSFNNNYSEALCLRDLGYLIDAIKYDLTYGGNMESVVAARSYYNGVVLQGGASNTLGNNAPHIAKTQAAFTYLGTKIQTLSGVPASVFARVNSIIGEVNQSIRTAESALVVGKTYEIVSLGATTNTQWNTIAGTTGVTYAVGSRIKVAQAGSGDGYAALVPTEVYADASWAETALQEVAVTMRLQRTTIQSQITDYVEAKFPGLMTATQKDKCARDAGLLIDAVRWDMLFNSNFRSIVAGRSYYRRALNLAADALASLGEKAATIAAFTYLKDILQGIAAANPTASERVTSNMDVILEIIENGTENNQANPTINFGTVSSTDRTKAKAMLLANKEFIKTEVINYINATYSQVTYDEEKCARDVELITTAIAYDMVQNGNFQTVRAAQGYLRANAANVLTDQQQHITVLAMKYLKNLLTNYVGGNSLAATRVKALIDIVITIVYEESATNLPALNYGTAPTPAKWTATGITGSSSSGSIQSISNKVIDYINASASGYTVPTGYNETKCRRDLQYILEGLRYDLTHGGNWATVVNARAYFVGTQAQLGSVAAEKTATTRAYTYLKTLADLTNVTTGVVDGVDADDRAAALIQIIIDVINGGVSAIPAIQYPELLGSNDALEAARNILISNIPNAKAKTIRWVNNRSYFVYNIVKCERDIGLILDAVHNDVLTGSNVLSVQAGTSYLRASASGAIAAPQKWAILAGLTQAKSILSSLVSTNADIVSAIRARLSIVIDIINDNVAPAITFSSGNTVATINTTGSSYVSLYYEEATAKATAGTAPNVITSANRIAAKTTLRTDATRKTVIKNILDYADSNTPATSYNKAKCGRDIALILDALAHDLLHGGNLATRVAAAAYFVGTSNQLGAVANEITETVTCLGQLKTQIAALTPFSGVAALVTETNARIDEIIAVINGGLSALAAESPPSFTGVSATNTSARTTLVAAKEASTFKILEAVNTREYLDYTGDTVTKCERDVNTIVDALSFDVAKSSNFKSIKAAQAYLRSYSKVVTEEQKQATIGSFYFIKKKVTEAVAAASGDPTSARALMDTIIDIVDRGITATPSLVITATADTDQALASAILVNNAAFIKAEIRAYLDKNYPELDYNKIKCERDVQYILDALRYDLVFGGDSETKEAGLAYWEGNKLTLGTHPTGIDAFDIDGGEDEKTATVAAYTYLAGLVKTVLNNTSYTPLQVVTSKGTYVTSSTSGVRAADLADTAKELIDNLVLIVNNAPGTLAGAIAAAGTITKPSTPNTTIAALTLASAVSTEIRKAFVTANGDGTGAKVQFFVYNQTKCARDVGFIVESLAFDALYGGNKESRTAALEYAYKGGLMIPIATKGPTVGGFKRLKAILPNIVQGTALASVSTGTTAADQVLNNETVNSVTYTGASAALGTEAADNAQYVLDVIKGGAAAAPTLVDPTFANVTGFKPDYLVVRAVVRDSIPTVAANTIKFINETYAGFGYLQDTCKRDVGLTVDAMAYDLIYGGNSRTKFAAEQYFSGGRFQIPADSKSATVACFEQLGALAAKVVRNEPIVTFQNYVDQDKSNPTATQSEVTNISSLTDAFTDILSNGYISVLQLDATFNGSVDDNTFATFHQVSTITTTGHTLEWVGTGIDVDSALPYNGGVPKPQNQLVSDKGGFINFTSTDEKGDFRIGPDLTIKRDSGSIIGRAFNKSLLGVVTPYILALQS